MNKYTKNLNQFLSSEYKRDGFIDISGVLRDLPGKMICAGGIEKKTLNMHRVICIAEYSDEIKSFGSAIIELKRSLQKTLKAKFWRGLGVGIILYSENLFENELLEDCVYSGEKASRSLIQWIINISQNSENAKIIHTFSNVSTTFMINETLDFLEIPVKNRVTLISGQTPPFKTKISLR